MLFLKISPLYKFLRKKQIANLKPVKYVFSICANVTLLVAVIELAIGVVGNFFHSTILKAMLINVSVWLILFLASMGKLVYDKKKLKNLKHSGTCMDSEIEDMIPAAWIRVGNVLPPFIQREDLYANVYIDDANPAQYSVELFQTG